MTSFFSQHPDKYHPKPYDDDPIAEPVIDTAALRERLLILVDELQLPIEWQRPAIILAVYRSEVVRRYVEARLETELATLNQTVDRYRITGADTADVLLELAKRPAEERANTVYLIAGLQFGGGEDGRNAYRALNLRREYFTDYNLRAVVWLTEAEAAQLPFYAPDFWSFRQYVAEFLDTPTPTEVAQELDKIAETDNEQDLTEKIMWREDLLANLPDTPESQPSRADLLLKLAKLYKNKGERKTAQTKAETALALFEQLEDTERQADCYIVLGNIQHDLKNPDEAVARYHQAIALNPTSGLAYWGLGDI